ncbi:MAG TPA: glutathione S-transferase family protein [Acidiferrobacterales bacterium]
MRRLISIPMSHYCEKARWALDRLGLRYREERHLQVFHYPRAYWFSRGPTVPVLVDGGVVVADSAAILRFLDQYAPAGRELYPADPALRAEVVRWERLFDDELGVESRRWVYFHMLPRPLRGLRTAGDGVPWYELMLAPLCYPAMRALIARKLDVRADTVARGLARCRQIVADTDARLADGRRYLVGDRLSATDISLACMLAPFILPAQYGSRLPEIDSLPAPMRAEVLAVRATATGRFALRLFERERHPG